MYVCMYLYIHIHAYMYMRIFKVRERKAEEYASRSEREC